MASPARGARRISAGSWEPELAYDAPPWAEHDRSRFVALLPDAAKAMIAVAPSTSCGMAARRAADAPFRSLLGAIALAATGPPR